MPNFGPVRFSKSIGESGSHRHSPVMGWPAPAWARRWLRAVGGAPPSPSSRLSISVLRAGPGPITRIFRPISAGHWLWREAAAWQRRDRIAQRAVERHRDLVGEQHLFTAESRGVLAITLALEGDIAGAIAEFKAAAPFLRSRWRPKRDDDLTQAAKNQRVDLILEAYLDILARNRNPANFRGDGFDAITESYRAASLAHGIRVLEKHWRSTTNRARRGFPSGTGVASADRPAQGRARSHPSPAFGATGFRRRGIACSEDRMAPDKARANSPPSQPSSRGARAARLSKTREAGGRPGSARPRRDHDRGLYRRRSGVRLGDPQVGPGGFRRGALSRREIATAVSACGGLVRAFPTFPSVLDATNLGTKTLALGRQRGLAQSGNRRARG